MTDSRRMRWSRNGDLVTVSLRDTSGYVMMITLPASQWPPEGDEGELVDEEDDDDSDNARNHHPVAALKGHQDVVCL